MTIEGKTITMRYRAGGAVKAVKETETQWELEVLGIPYGGPIDGRDWDGEFFSDKTDTWMAEGEQRPSIYFHGYTPEGLREPEPEIMGSAELARKDDQGHWFRVMLNKTAKYAQRVWDAAQEGMAKASSGALGHLVRVSPMNGEILRWAIGELSLFDTDEEAGRMPANDWAVVIPVKALTERFTSVGLEVPEALQGSGEDDGGAVQSELEDDNQGPAKDTSNSNVEGNQTWKTKLLLKSPKATSRLLYRLRLKSTRKPNR